MKKKKVTFIIEASSTGFGAYTNDDFPPITAYAKTIPELKEDLLEVVQEYIDYEKEVDGKTDPLLNGGNLEFVYKYDLESIFANFGMLDVTNFAKRVGLNPSLMRQYKSGLAKASDKQKRRIEKGLHDLGRELLAISIL